MRVPKPATTHGVRTVVAYTLERDTLARSFRTSLVVGTILALINHGQQLLSGQFSPAWVIPMLLTYLVPFAVATYGQVQGKRQQDQLHAMEASRSAPHEGSASRPSQGGGRKEVRR